MAYEVVMSYHLHMPSYFLGTFTEYPFLCKVLAVILPKIAGKKYLSGQSEKLKHSEHSLEESEILSADPKFSN